MNQSWKNTQSTNADRFISLVTPLKGQLERFCKRTLQQPSDSEDVLQTAVTLAFRDFKNFAEGTNFRAWIFRYVTLETLNRNRAVARERRFVELNRESTVSGSDVTALERLALDDPEALIENLGESFDQAVLGALMQLPDNQRAVFVLRSIGEFSYRETAEILDVPIGTVMGLLSRARKSLRIALGTYAKENGFLKRGNSA